jgi:hypothetical protein
MGVADTLMHALFTQEEALSVQRCEAFAQSSLKWLGRALTMKTIQTTSLRRRI